MHSIVKLLSSTATAVALSVLLVIPAQAQVNTGFDVDGGLDQSWTALDGQFLDPSGSFGAWVIDPADQHSNWAEPTAGSAWITREEGWEFEATDDIWTTYFMNFMVDVPATAFSLTGSWATDNNAMMFLNGTHVSTSSFTAFSSLSDFELNDGFVTGTNTLAVQVYNGSGSGNPSGLLVSDLESQVVPEPMTFVLLGTGLLGLAVAARRRREDELTE